jgi:outer membrane protein TolC
LYTDYLSKRKVAILQAYLNVLLADIIFEHADQALAIAYIKFDKLRSRFELQQVSDIELLDADNNFRKSRRERSQAESDQRLSRHRLAQLISPGQLANKLEMPDLDSLSALSLSRELGELETLYAQAKKNNPSLLALNHKLESAKLKRDGFEAEKYPVISAHLQAADYAREVGSSDKFRASIEVSVPLYQAGQENANIKRTNGEITQLKAEQLRLNQDIEQQILELWLKISNLKQQSEDPDVTLNYRDLYLERSRALYELEVTSDLGDAMVQLTHAQLFKAQTQFELAIAWSKLDALLGNSMNYYEQ